MAPAYCVFVYKPCNNCKIWICDETNKEPRPQVFFSRIKINCIRQNKRETKVVTMTRSSTNLDWPISRFHAKYTGTQDYIHIHRMAWHLQVEGKNLLRRVFFFSNTVAFCMLRCLSSAANYYFHIPVIALFSCLSMTCCWSLVHFLCQYPRNRVLSHHNFLAPKNENDNVIWWMEQTVNDLQSSLVFVILCPTGWYDSYPCYRSQCKYLYRLNMFVLEHFVRCGNLIMQQELTIEFDFASIVSYPK